MNQSRVVLDTNVFVAAAFEPKSASARLLEALSQGRCRMVLDWQHFAPLFRPEWEHSAELDLAPFRAIEDPDDRKFAALAAATQSVLVSQDDHLLARRGELPIRVLRPSEFLDELIGGKADARR